MDSAKHAVPERVGELRRRLLEHYDAHRRDLPWRRADDPYRIWVSEVMLQQTRVDTVIPYYRRWMERFPELEDLASADREEVLQAWTGLGYYSRARNLHRAAGLVRERHGGRLPGSVEELLRLPGVGEYTAGAVASIAFGIPAPAVDGNVRRVLSRLDDLPEPGAAELRERAAALVDPDRPGGFNQAVMELGAMVCTPSSPSCTRCPVEDLCLARARDTVEERPPPRKRKKVGRRRMAVGIAVDAEGRTLMVRRPERGLLGGMWEFPALAIPEETEALPEDPAVEQTAHPADDRERSLAEIERDVALEMAREVARKYGATLHDGAPARLSPLSHAFTHLRVTYLPHLFLGASFPAPSGSDRVGALPVDQGGPGDALAAPVGEADRVRVVSLGDLDALPLPVAQQKIARRVRERMEEVLR